MRLLFLGFGTVGQGLAELLLAKRDELARRFGFDWQVTGIADTLKGSVYDRPGSTSSGRSRRRAGARASPGSAARAARGTA